MPDESRMNDHAPTTEHAMEELKIKVAIGLAQAKHGLLSDGDAFFAELEQEEAKHRDHANPREVTLPRDQ